CAHRRLHSFPTRRSSDLVLIQARLREPEKWKQAVAAGGVRKAGSYRELLGDPRWRWNAVFGLILALSGVIGLWGIGFCSYDLQRSEEHTSELQSLAYLVC